jgi:hypothetical protein
VSDLGAVAERSLAGVVRLPNLPVYLEPVDPPTMRRARRDFGLRVTSTAPNELCNHIVRDGQSIAQTYCAAQSN